MGWIQRLLNWFRKYRRRIPEPEQIPSPPDPFVVGSNGDDSGVLRSEPKVEPEKKPQDAPPPLPPKPKHRIKKPQSEASLSRHDRRRIDALRHKYEMARMKHDEWVVPGGAEPVKFDQDHHDASIEDLIIQKQEEEKKQVADEKKPKPEPKPVRLEPDFDPNTDTFIVDEWVEGDGKAHVLFEESEFYGVFNFRDTILNQLKRYWVYIERMKHNDPDAYGFYKRLGATLLPYAATGANRKHEYFKKYEGERLERLRQGIYLTPWFKKWWPAFGCICIGINPLDEEREIKDMGGKMWTPKFAYFVRLANVPWFVQPVKGGKIYIMTVWWDRPDHPKTHNKWGIPNSFPIWCSDDGTIIKALKTREAGDGTIRAEHDWRIPHAYEEWAKTLGLTAQEHLTQMFCHLARDMEEAAYATCRVEVTKGDLSAVFGIEPHRCPYFFKDRDITLNEYGHKQRVFHVVKSHIHQGKAVPLQYRGLTEFKWAGYDVSITIPGKDHFMLPEFNVPMRSYKNKARIPRGGMKEADLAEWLKQKIKRGFGAHH